MQYFWRWVFIITLSLFSVELVRLIKTAQTMDKRNPPPEILASFLLKIASFSEL